MTITQHYLSPACLEANYGNEGAFKRTYVEERRRWGLDCAML